MKVTLSPGVAAKVVAEEFEHVARMFTEAAEKIRNMDFIKAEADFNQNQVTRALENLTALKEG